jgi:DNA-binding transcriptional LysR family regulator
MSKTHPTLEQMNLNLMLALHWLLVEQSVTRAARRMGVSQSAMSRSLAQLRFFFADPLLVSLGSRLEPTPRAEGLREQIGGAVDLLRGALSASAPFDPARVGGILRVAATEHAMSAVVPPVLAAVRREAPGLEVSVEPAGADVFKLLAAGRFDVLFGPKVGPTPSRLTADTLLHERFVTVLRRGNPAAKRRLTLARFCKLEHVVVAPLGGERASLVSRALVQRGLERRVVLRVPYFASALEIVSKTDLALTLPASLAPRRLAVRRTPLEVPSFVLEAVWPNRVHASEQFRWLRALVRRESRELG